MEYGSRVKAIGYLWRGFKKRDCVCWVRLEVVRESGRVWKSFWKEVRSGKLAGGE